MRLPAIDGALLPLVIRTIRDPESAKDFSKAQWSLLVREARSRNVLGRVLLEIAEKMAPEYWPSRVRQIFQGEANLASHRRLSLKWEVEGLVSLLGQIKVAPVFLKGAAYAIQDFPFAAYRNFGDIDLMIPRERLADAERILTAGGWLPTNKNPYDQYYYRTWMHELPPLKHIHRGTILDLHHAILPLTARYSPSPSHLFDKAHELEHIPGARILAPEDMFLHAATHLFCEGEKENSLRNLCDLHDLFGELRSDDKYSDEALVQRATELDLIPILALASRYLHRVLQTPGAASLYASLHENSVSSKLGVSFQDWMFDTAFIGKNGGGESDGFSAWVRYMRGHYLRMPMGLLARHLSRKLWRELMRKESH